MDYFRRLDLVLLALMLACVIVVVIRSSCRLHRAGCLTLRVFRRVGTDSQASQQNLRELLASLRRAARTLKAIATTAPFLGLVGTCEGILNASGATAGERATGLYVITAELSAAPITAAVGILVAIPAVASYSYICTRIDLLERVVSGEPSDWRSRAARRFPLRKRFSQLPTFALMAAPLLAIALAADMVFPSFFYSWGLHVGLAPTPCQNRDFTLLLHLSGEGKVFLNFEEEHWDTLASRLSQIYRFRAQRILYLLADDDVPFQKVADAIDIAQNAGNLHITVELVTPAARECVPIPVRIIAPRHASK